MEPYFVIIFKAGATFFKRINKNNILKSRFTLTLLIVFLFGAVKINAQYIQFVENKGQWDSKVNFQGVINSGALFLQPTGYKILLHNAKDMERIADYYGGHLSKKDSATAGAQANRSAVASEKLILHSHAYEVKFLNALATAKPVPEKQENTYNNYFIGKDPSKWATHCRVFNAISYKDIYPKTDIRYYADNGMLKYDLIVNPGADVSKIAMQFDGVDGLSINKYGNLIIKTSLGEIAEVKPYSYQLDQKGRSKIDAKFELDGNTVRFKLGAYSKSATLVIDPALIFSTFMGSIADNWGYTATYDNAGNFYAGGIAFSNGYPFSPGAFQTVFGGGDNSEGAGAYDITIMKLNTNGSQRMYATYIGGGGDEQPHSLIVDNSGNLVISGRTTSPNFPITLPTLGPGGGFDIFLAKLNPDGTNLISSRKFGGKGSDGVNIAPKYASSPRGASSLRRNYGDDARSEVIVDNNDNVYLASCTRSGDYPVSANAFQKVLGGAQDGVIIKASPDLNNITTSYLGGNGDDAAFVLSLNPQDNNIYVAGGTNSDNFAVNSNNSGPILRRTFGGGDCDGFVSILSNDATTLIKSVYVGDGGQDLVYGIQFDKRGFPYIMGTTTSNLPVVNAAFNSEAKGKQFITKMQPDLNGIVYSTNFGKGQAVPDISPTAFLVDVCENVYVSGWGGGINIGDGYPNANTFNLSLTPNAISTITDGADFYFFVLEKNALSQLYGSYFGTDARNDPSVLGDHVDGGTSRFDRRGTIYQAICANCGRNGFFPTSAGVWSPNNPSTMGAKCNEAAVKIAFELAGVISSIQTSINGIIRDTSGCIPLTVQFTDTVALGKSYIWNFGDGTGNFPTVAPTITHTFNAIGNYRVMLVAVDSSSCNITDTSYVNIRARDNKANLSFTQTKLPPCESLNYEFNNTSTPPPGFPFGANTFTWDFGDGTTLQSGTGIVTHSYASAGTYNVTLRLMDTTYCNSPDSVQVQLRVSPILEAQFETPLAGCAPYTAVFNNTSLGGQQFTWDFGDGSPVSTEVSPTHLYANTGTFTVRLSAVDNSTCNTTDDTTVTITVNPSPVAVFQFGPQPPKENTPTQFINISTGAVRYKWDFGDGDTLITTRIDTPVTHIYNATGNYKACLTAYNEFGCSDDTCQFIEAIVSPLVDVPNAFTPNGDGVNDVVRVRGFGIQKMTWRIYNRWGKLVFQAASPSQAWDGKYQGVLQPQEVYAYVLEIMFTDNTQVRKRGDITLIR